MSRALADPFHGEYPRPRADRPGSAPPHVTPENVRAAGMALQATGVEFQTLVFEDDGHEIRRSKNQKVLYKRLAAFFTI